LSGRNLAVLAGLASAGMLLAAFGFQYLGDMAPCKMCLWQRWPHAIAAALALVLLFLPHRLLMLAGGALVLAGAGIAFYHAGVEQHWWLGPTTCTSQGINGLSADELMSQILNAPLVRCDEIPWSLFGLSMAAWNAVVSVGIALLWLRAFRVTAAR